MQGWTLKTGTGTDCAGTLNTVAAFGSIMKVSPAIIWLNLYSINQLTFFLYKKISHRIIFPCRICR